MGTRIHGEVGPPVDGPAQSNHHGHAKAACTLHAFVIQPTNAPWAIFLVSPPSFLIGFTQQPTSDARSNTYATDGIRTPHATTNKQLFSKELVGPGKNGAGRSPRITCFVLMDCWHQLWPVRWPACDGDWLQIRKFKTRLAFKLPPLKNNRQWRSP